MGVFLYNDTTGATIETTDINGDGGESQAALHEANGWRRIESAAAAAAPIIGRPIGSLDELNDEELHEVAVRNFVPVDDDTDLPAVLREHFGDTTSAPAVDPQANDDDTAANGDAINDEEN